MVIQETICLQESPMLHGRLFVGKVRLLGGFRSEIPRMLPLVAQQLSEIQAPHKLYAKVPTWKMDV